MFTPSQAILGEVFTPSQAKLDEVTPLGFEPRIFGMKTRRPRPLDDGANKLAKVSRASYSTSDQIGIVDDGANKLAKVSRASYSTSDQIGIVDDGANKLTTKIIPGTRVFYHQKL